MANLLTTCATSYGSSTLCWSSGDIKAANFWVCSGSDSYSLGQGSGILDIWISDSSISHQPRSIFRAYNQGNCIILGQGCSANTNATIPVYACNCLQSPTLCATGMGRFGCLCTVGSSMSCIGSCLNIAGNVIIGAGGTGPSVKVRHIDGKCHTDDTPDTLYLQYNTAKNVTVGRSACNANLCVYGSSIATNLCATSRTYYGSNSAAYIHSNGNYLRHENAYGYIQLGPENSSWAHIITDRNSFYFNCPIAVNGGHVRSYDENLVLSCAGGSNARIVIGSGTTTSCQGMAICGNVGIGRVPSNYPLMLKGNTRYQLALCNSGSGDSDYPWFVHDNDNVVIHFNGVGDRYCFHNSGAFCATCCVKTTRVCSLTAACVCACAYSQGSIVVGTGTATTCVGAFGGWYDIAELTEWNTPAHWSIKTCAHNTLTFTTTMGYHGSNTASINVLNSSHTGNSCYIHVNCIRIACQANSTYRLQLYLCRTSATGCLGAVYVTVHNLNQAWIHGTSMNVSLCACLCPGVSCNTITSQLACSNTHRMSCSLSVCGSVTTGILCGTTCVYSNCVYANYINADVSVTTPIIAGTGSAASDYGAVQVTGAKNNWGGMHTCGFTFMACCDCSTVGIYNDSTNEWVFKGISNSSSYMYYNGTVKGQALCRGFRACGQTTGCGYLDLCPNGSWGHLITDRSKFYANKPWIVDTGCVGSYDEDLTLHRGQANGTAGERIVITSGTTHICQCTKVHGIAEAAKVHICAAHNCLHMASICDSTNYNFTICSMYNWANSLAITNRCIPILKACFGNCVTSLWGNNTERICLHPTGTKIIGNLCVTGTVTADGMEGDTLSCATVCTGTICFNTSCATGLDAVYDIYVSSNPNCAGSASYRDIVHLTSYVTTGWSGSAVTKYINTINKFSRNDLHGSGGGEVTATAKLLVGTVGADSYAAACATCLQVQVSGGSSKDNTCVIIKKVL